MLGSAFAVVLPEGFEHLYSAAMSTAGHHDEHEGHRRLLHSDEEDMHAHDHAHDGEYPSWAPGMALLAGFVLMLVFEFWHHQYEHKSHEGPNKVRNQLFECTKVRLRARHCNCEGSEQAAQDKTVQDKTRHGTGVHV